MPNLKNRQPDNINLLQQNKFTVTFERIPTVQFFCQSVNLPGITSDLPTQYMPGLNKRLPGSKATLEQFTMSFIVDENLRSWMEIYEWIKDYSTMKKSDDYGRLNQWKQGPKDRPQYSNAIVTINSNLNHPNIRIKFSEIFPSSLSGITFDSKTTDITTLEATATFQFTDYEIEFVGNPAEQEG